MELSPLLQLLLLLLVLLLALPPQLKRRLLSTLFLRRLVQLSCRL